MNWLAMDAGRASAWAEYFWMALWVCGGHVVRHQEGKATRDLAGESAASDTTTVWIWLLFGRN